MAAMSIPQPRKRRRSAEFWLYVALSVVGLIIILPLIWIFLMSFKTDFDAITNAANPIPNPFTVHGYTTLFSSDQQPILLWFVNSLLAALIQASLILVTAALAAYPLARMEFRGKKIVFGVIIATLMVPPVVFLIPNYLIVRQLDWLDSLWAVTIPGAAGAFGVFFLRQFFASLPGELEEAARLDGAGDLRIFLRIVLPLAKPALATLFVISFLNNWNDFLWPVYVLLSPEHLTLQPGLKTLSGAYSTHFSIVMAGAVIAAVPVLILFGFAQKQIVESVATTGMKG